MVAVEVKLNKRLLKMITIHAYLPTLGYMVVTQGDGAVGCMYPDGTFAPKFSDFLNAAVSKYGYTRLDKPLTVTPEQAKEKARLYAASDA